MRWPFRMLIGLCVVAAGFLLTVLWLHRYRNDAALARYIMDRFNPVIRGRMEFGTMHWRPEALVDLALGVPSRVDVEHFAVYDPAGRQILYAPRATGTLELYPLLFGGGHLLIRDLQVSGARCLVAPLGSGGRKIGLLEAFAGRRPGKGRAPRIEFRDFNVKKAAVTFQFASWRLDLDDLGTQGTLLYRGGKPALEGLVIQHRTTVPSGKLTVGESFYLISGLQIDRLGGSEQRPTELDVGLSGTISGAKVQATGKLTGVYAGRAAIDLSVSAHKLRHLLSRLLGPGASGDIRLVATLRGLLARPEIRGRVFGLAMGKGAARIEDLAGELHLDLEGRRVTARDVRCKLLGGHLRGDAQVDLGTGDWKGNATLADVDPGRLDPLLAGTLSGTVALKGAARPLHRGLGVVRLKLARARRDLLPRVLDVDGTVHLGSEILDLAGVKLSGEGHALRARGSINLPRRQTDLWLELGSPRLGAWLERKGLPAVARTLETEVHVTGRYPALRATGHLGGGGVGYGPLRLERVGADVAFERGTLRLNRLRSSAYGGDFAGEATLALLDDQLRPRATPTLHATARSTGLDLTALGGKAFNAVGRVFAELEVSGPFDNLTGTATLRIPQATLQGDRYVGSRVRLGLLKDRVSIYEGVFQRADGGQLSVRGDVFFADRLDLHGSVQGFPVSGIPWAARLPLGLSGKISGRLSVTGPRRDPQVAGNLSLAGARVRGVELGSGQLQLAPSSDGVRLDGRFFGRLLSLSGYLLTQPTPRLHLTIDLTRLPLEKLFYEMRQLGDVRGVADGRIRLAVDGEKGLTWADAKFPRVRLEMRYRPPGVRRVQVISLSNQEDLLARFDGEQLHVVTARLLTTVPGQARQRAQFSVGGWLGSAGTDVRLRGRVAVELLEFFLARLVKRLAGDARADLRLTGTLARPKLEGELWIDRVRIEMPKFDRTIEIPQGHVRLTPDAVRLEGIQVRVGREQLTAGGTVELVHLRPTMTDLQLAGDVNLELLELFFPEQISDASGAARIRLRVRGPLADPQLEGELAVQRIELSPRGWGRTITLSAGRLGLNRYTLTTLAPLEGSYDEGALQVSGEVRLDRWELADVNLQIVGTGIPQRQPNVYSAELNLNLSLIGDSGQLALAGTVDLVDVRYVRQFDVVRQAFIRARTYEEEDPFWRGTPLLETLTLDLAVRSTGQMVVKNDYAQLSLGGVFNVVGSLAEPRLHGQIRVEEGTFRIPFLRGEYTLRQGDIVFKKGRAIDEAELSLLGETLFVDHGGAEYQVRLALEGTLSQIGIQLSSEPSLEQGQIWALMATGRTTQQLRSQLKGAVDPSTGTAGTQAAGAADSHVKELTGEILNQIMVDPLKKATRLDLLRFEMGTESAQVKAGKRLGRFVNLAGEGEIGLLGDSRAEGRLEFKMHDLLMLVGKWERLSTRLETEDVDPSRGRIELKVSLPLR